MRHLVAIVLVCVLSACTFTHAAIYHRAPEPYVQLSPGIARLARADEQTPWYVPTVDIALFMGGWMAGPVTGDPTANIAGLALTGLVAVSLAATLAIWGHP